MTQQSRVEYYKNKVAKEKGYPSWEEMENWIIDNNPPVNVAVILVAMMEEVAGYSTSQGQWQLCPKCGGRGMAMNFKNYIPTTMDTCDVCDGKKIIAPPSISTRGEDAIELIAGILYANKSDEGDEGSWINSEHFYDVAKKIAQLFNPSSSPSTREGAKSKLEILDKYPHVRGTTEGDESRFTMKLGDLWKMMEEYKNQSAPTREGGLQVKEIPEVLTLDAEINGLVNGTRVYSSKVLQNYFWKAIDAIQKHLPTHPESKTEGREGEQELSGETKSGANDVINTTE
jgi:hypothetical protein